MDSTRLERLCAAIAAGEAATGTDEVSAWGMEDDGHEKFAAFVVKRARALEKAIAEAVDEPTAMKPDPSPTAASPIVVTIHDERTLERVLVRLSFGEPLKRLAPAFDIVPLKGGEGWLVRLTFDRPDANTGVVGRGKSRQEFVPIGATVASVVRTCWVLVELTARHEAMEAFRFDGERVFDPHAPIGGVPSTFLGFAEPARETTDDHLRRCGFPGRRDVQTKNGRSLLMALVEASSLVVCPGCHTVLKDRFGQWPRPMSNEPLGFTLPRLGWDGEIESEARAAGLGHRLHFA